MKITHWLAFLAITAVYPVCILSASPVLTLDPSSGSISGLPGDTVGWGFTLTSDDTEWISVVTTSLINESNPALGFYTDTAGLFGGPMNAVLAPGAAPWVMSFDALNQTGLGAYTIDPSAPIGAMDAGMIDLNYETFSADPNICSSCATGFGDLQVQVQVTAATPEPANFVTFLFGIALVVLSRRLTGHRRPARAA